MTPSPVTSVTHKRNRIKQSMLDACCSFVLGILVVLQEHVWFLIGPCTPAMIGSSFINLAR